ncbi:MAG: prepilin-type N-terminal cleavage/methylation domain-containing protein [Patescibacteria group bacterium]
MVKNKSGFTIVELLVVIVVIGILASITMVAFSNVQASARDAERKTELASIAKALQIYELRNGPMYTGSGCGSGGNGNGFFNHEDTTSYLVSMNACLKNAGIVSTDIIDPSGSTSCSGYTCRTYMKYTCVQSGETVTYVFANLEGLPNSDTATNTTCGTAIDQNQGMNYYIKL